MTNKKQNPTLDQRVLQFIQEYELISPGQRILVAVSGGPDSICLLYALFKMQSDLNIKIHMAHLNHQLRGEESEADARYVENLARKLDIPATVEKRDVVGYQSEHRLSLEEAAREVRYSFLAQTANSLGMDKVAVGHTLNDQVETVLLHLLRGTGTRGLCGLQPCHTAQFAGNRLTVIRPLLEIKREEIEEYCFGLQLTPCRDSSNLSLSMLRNRIRRELLPLLQSYNPRIFESLTRISRIAQNDLAFLDSETEKVWDAAVREEGRTFVLDKIKFIKLAPALQRQLLRRAIDELLGTLKDIEAQHIEEILDALSKPTGKRITLPEGLIFSIEYNRYVLGFSPGELTPFPELKGEFDINIPGETRLPGWIIEATISSRKKIPDSQVSLKSDGFIAYFDKEKTGGKIKVRTRRRGDYFQPLGMNCPKKVGEFMLDARIPKTWRERIPIVYSSQQIIWIAGWRIDERVKVTGNTRQVLCLKMVRG